MNPTERFSDRAENYAKFRPDYPEAFIRFLADLLPAPATIADVGSGTGILTQQLLQAGYTVWAVEPNSAMRAEAERRLGRESNFRSVAAAAEATTLADGVAQAVTCAQSFHWFDRGPCRVEFERILQAPKFVLLIWNERISEGPMAEYDRILKDSAPGKHNITDAEIEEFFAPAPFDLLYFPHLQRLDREAFIGRVLSSSYVPNVGSPGHELVMDKMRAFFDQHASAGRIEFPYQTRVYVADLGNSRSRLAIGGLGSSIQ